MTDIQEIAGQAVQLLQWVGFDEAQVSVDRTSRDEVNFAHNTPNLLRSTESYQLRLLGLLDGRKASTDLSDSSNEAVRQAVNTLFESVKSAPQDDANSVSGNESANLVQGPQNADLTLMADKVREILDYRASQTPKMHLEEGYCAHGINHSCTMTSKGSQLNTSIGSYQIVVSGTARDGTATSSFNYTGGDCNDLTISPVVEMFGIDRMLHETERQIHSKGISESFKGDVILSPHGVGDILSWLSAQVSDSQLLTNSSVYRNRVGENIASPALTISSRFDGPGVCPITADAFTVKPLVLIDNGKLETLLPSFYGSRKTGIAHKPSLMSAWEVHAGDVSQATMIESISRGAYVGRLSMGNPAPNGDFSAVIKNSFIIENGKLGEALSGVMITGNVAQMLRDIVAISRERLDSGATLLPWLQVRNLHFS